MLTLPQTCLCSTIVFSLLFCACGSDSSSGSQTNISNKDCGSDIPRTSFAFNEATGNTCEIRVENEHGTVLSKADCIVEVTAGGGVASKDPGDAPQTIYYLVRGVAGVNASGSFAAARALEVGATSGDLRGNYHQTAVEAGDVDFSLNCGNNGSEVKLDDLEYACSWNDYAFFRIAGRLEAPCSGTVDGEMTEAAKVVVDFR